METREDQARYAAYDPMPIGVLVARTDSTVLHANPRLLALVGRCRHEVVGSSFKQLIAPEDSARVLERFARRLSGAFVNEEYRCGAIRGDGARIDVEITVRVVDAEVLVLVRDVTDWALRRNQRMELVRFCATLRALHSEDDVIASLREGLKAQGVYSVWVEPDGERVRVRFADLPGPTLDRFEGDSGLSVPGLVGDWTPSVRNAWIHGHAYTDDAHTEVSTFLEQPFGSVAAELLVAAGLTHAVGVRVDRGGVPVAVLVMHAAWLREDDLATMQLLVRQISAALDSAREIARARKRMDEAVAIRALARAVTGTLNIEEVLRVGGDALRGLLDASQCFVLLFDPVSRCLQGRVAVSEFVDHHIEDVSIPVESRSAAALCYRERRVVVIDDAPNDPRTSAALVARYGEKSLMAVPMGVRDAVLGVLIVDECRQKRLFSSAEVSCAELVADQLAVAVDNARLYSDLRRSYAELEAAQTRLMRQERLAALGELSAVVAHEVRNPLAVIFNSLGGLERVVPPEGDGRVLFEIIREEADRLNRIVGDLLDFARPRHPTLREEFLDKLLDEAVGSALSVESGPVIRLKREVPEPVGPVLIDARLIRQAVVNLALNAVQAMPRGGTLTLRAGNSPSGVWFDLADTGVGISPEALAKVYEPFFTTRAMGTGLGLPIVRRIIESHGGEIQIESREGQGTVVSVKLPTRGV